MRVNSTTGVTGWAVPGPFWRSLPNSYLATSSKNLSPSKKSPQIEYTKSDYFLILSNMGYANFFVKKMTFDFVVVDWPMHEKSTNRTLKIL